MVLANIEFNTGGQIVDEWVNIKNVQKKSGVGLLWCAECVWFELELL